MIIDIHTHIFPDSLADRAMSGLYGSSNGILKPVHNGRLSGLMENMDAWGIDISVIQPVITKQSQTEALNQWAASVQSDRIISFGGIYPHTDDYKRDIDFVASLGLKGLKFHAEYQGFVADDERMLKIYDYCLSKGLILLHHAGYDIGFPPPYRSSPKMFANIADAMKGGVIIVAHLGGGGQWGDVEAILAGKNVYLDTSMGFDFYSEEQFLRIADKHGTDKLLFASDSPWSNGEREINRIKSLPLPEKDICAILGGNAMRVLELDK